MALLAKYQTYLAHPAAEHLTDAASVIYVPTVSSVSGSTAILKHHRSQSREVKKQSEKIVNVVEGANSLCIETETTLKFETGGGTYLPGLDDNFIADKTVTLPIIHIVQFSNDDKIEQVRIYWDQGALLKSVEVIGARSKNWPLNVGSDQLKVISSSVSASASAPNTQEAVDDRNGRSRSRFGANGDKYATLSLFKPREENNDDDHQQHAFSPPPRASAKPPPREWEELFATGEGSTVRSSSPKKNVENPLKGGAGSHYHENRLFDPERNADEPKSPEKSFKVHPKKYEHFEFGDAPPPVSDKTSTRAGKHTSQWDFSDFVTPHKPKPKNLPELHQRHFSWSDEEEKVQKPLADRPNVPKPRPDAVSQFEITDEAPADEQTTNRPAPKKDQQGLYNDHILSSGEHLTTKPGSGSDGRGPLGNITNVEGHRKAFGSQIELADDSPPGQDPFQGQSGNRDENAANKPKKPIQAHKKAQSMMAASWSLFDDNTEPVKRPSGIKIAGNGQGTRTATESNWWDFESAS